MNAVKRKSRLGILAEGQEPGSNILFLIFQTLRITHYHMNFRRISGSPRYRRRGEVRGLKSDLRSDLEQGVNINVVVRRDPAAGDLTRLRPPLLRSGPSTPSITTCSGTCGDAARGTG
jgi:hypothetical protein